MWYKISSLLWLFAAFHSHKGLTCHYCANEKKHREEDVSCQCAEPVDDLPLADGEYNAEHLCLHNTQLLGIKLAFPRTHRPTSTLKATTTTTKKKSKCTCSHFHLRPVRSLSGVASVSPAVSCSLKCCIQGTPAVWWCHHLQFAIQGPVWQSSSLTAASTKIVNSSSVALLLGNAKICVSYWLML